MSPAPRKPSDDAPDDAAAKPPPRKPARAAKTGAAAAKPAAGAAKTGAGAAKPAAGAAKTGAAAAKPAAGAKPAGASRARSSAGATRAAAGESRAASTESTRDSAQAQPTWFGLHSLAPAPGSRRPRKRVGRGEGSGTGKTAGRGQKGYGSRSGSKRRARFEGGQMPIHMRMRKLRGPHMKKSMPFEPFRTHTQAINLDELDRRFDSGAAVTLEALHDHGLGTRKGIAVKILAKGELEKPLTVHAHAFSAAARAKIEAAGGTCVVLES